MSISGKMSIGMRRRGADPHDADQNQGRDDRVRSLQRELRLTTWRHSDLRRTKARRDADRRKIDTGVRHLARQPTSIRQDARSGHPSHRPCRDPTFSFGASPVDKPNLDCPSGELSPSTVEQTGPANAAELAEHARVGVSSPLRTRRVWRSRRLSPPARRASAPGLSWPSHALLSCSIKKNFIVLHRGNTG